MWALRPAWTKSGKHLLSCEAAFKAYDTDGSGLLSFTELKAALVSSSGGDLDEAAVESVFSSYDLDGSGDISITEFARLWEESGGYGGGDGRVDNTASLEEQAAELRAAITTRILPLKAVLSNVPPALRKKVDELVEKHLGKPMRLLNMSAVSKAGSKKGGASGGSTKAPCAPLRDPPGQAGWYNGVVLLLFYPDVPADLASTCETLMKELLKVRAPSGPKGFGPHDAKVHHVIAVPCGDFDAFCTGGADYHTKPYKRWPTPYPTAAGKGGGHAMLQHPRLPLLLEPLVDAIDPRPRPERVAAAAQAAAARAQAAADRWAEREEAARWRAMQNQPRPPIPPCLLPDAIVHVLSGGENGGESGSESGSESEPCVKCTRVDRVRAGDFLLTGTAGHFRRVNRVWRTPVGHEVHVYEPSPGGRVTGLHPILAADGDGDGDRDSEWRYANARLAAPPRTEYVPAVYNLELEGHVDTVQLGWPAPGHSYGVVAACIGKYCGEACDGWSVWTRKTRRCDAATCTACDACVHPEFDFARRSGRPRLAVRFEPYQLQQHEQQHA